MKTQQDMLINYLQMNLPCGATKDDINHIINHVLSDLELVTDATIRYNGITRAEFDELPFATRVQYTRDIITYLKYDIEDILTGQYALLHD